MHVASCFCLVSPLDLQEQEQQEQQEQEQAKRVPDGHDRAFQSWPWQEQDLC